jgi:hypothetical protein
VASVPPPADLRARLLEQLGEPFDLVVPRDIRGKTIGEQAERSRRRERFQSVAHELARELVRASRRPAVESDHKTPPTEVP